LSCFGEPFFFGNFVFFWLGVFVVFLGLVFKAVMLASQVFYSESCLYIRMKYIVLCFLVLLPFVFSVSSSDAVNMVIASNHYLYDSETYTPPNVQIKFENKSYWVIPLTSGKDVVTYFPIESSKGELSTSRQINRGLFEVSDSLRELQLLKASISQGRAVDWIFTQKYSEIFAELSIQLQDEIFQLNTADSILSSNKIDSDLSPLVSSLSSMSSLSSEISQYIFNASKSEDDFFQSPSPDSLSELKESYEKVFSGISSLNEKAIAYRSEISKLKQEISFANIDAETKSQLFNILDVPSGLNAVRNYNLDSIQIKTSVDSAFSKTSLRMDSMLSELDNRVLKNKVHNLIYSDNEKLKKATGFSSLFEAQKNILSGEVKDSWENSSKVNDLEKDYLKAVELYNKRAFSQSEKYANLAIDDAIAVYRGGKKNKPVSSIDNGVLINFAIILAVLLIVLFAFNNSGKIKKWVEGKKDEVDLYG